MLTEDPTEVAVNEDREKVYITFHTDIADRYKGDVVELLEIEDPRRRHSCVFVRTKEGWIESHDRHYFTETVNTRDAYALYKKVSEIIYEDEKGELK